MYRNRKAAEVHIETAADAYKAAMAAKVAGMRAELAAGRAGGDAAEMAKLRKAIGVARAETARTFASMKREEKAEAARIKAEERAADREFAEMLKKKAPQQGQAGR
jgi:ribose transport system permease protein